MREFLERCSLRLATHPELRVAYERKYGLPFYLLPAVAPDRLIAREPTQPRDDIHVVDMHDKTGGKRGAMIGSFWDQSWFDRLCAALAPTGYSIDWFGNNRSPFVRFPKEQLLRARINPRGIVSEDQLAAELREYPLSSCRRERSILPRRIHRHVAEPSRPNPVRNSGFANSDPGGRQHKYVRVAIRQALRHRTNRGLRPPGTERRDGSSARPEDSG